MKLQKDVNNFIPMDSLEALIEDIHCGTCGRDITAIVIDPITKTITCIACTRKVVMEPGDSIVDGLKLFADTKADVHEVKYE